MRIWLNLVVLALCINSYAADPRPDAKAIAAALERGKALRSHKEVVPAVLTHSAALMTIGGVRCGHARVLIEQMQGEQGAVYRLKEEFRVASAAKDRGAIVEYIGVFYLDASLGLLVGLVENTWTMTEAGSNETVATRTELNVQDDKLKIKLMQRRLGDKELLTGSEERRLHGVRPIPKNAVTALAALAVAKSDGGFKPDPARPVCVPLLSMAGEQVTIDPLWLVFDAPEPANPKGTALQLRQRVLAGELTEKGLEVEPPTAQIWNDVEAWPLDGKYCPLLYPAPDNPLIKVEVVEAAALDSKVALDLGKIAEATQAANQLKGRE